MKVVKSGFDEKYFHIHPQPLLLSLLSVTMKHKEKDLMKSKQTLRGETYSLTVADNTAKSDEKCWRFLRKVFPYRSHPQPALLFSLLSVTMKHKGKDYEKQRSIAWTNIFIHCRIQHSRKWGRFWQKVFPHFSATLHVYIFCWLCILGRITLPVTKYKTIGLAHTKTFSIA